MRTILLDIDADFMVGNANGHAVKKPQVTGREYGRHLKRFQKKSTEVHLMVDHHEALYHWDQAGIIDAMCIHIDAHHDMWKVPDVHKPIVEKYMVNFQDPRRGLRTYEQVDCGNYLHQAMIDGMVGKVIYVPAPFRTLTHERDDIIAELRDEDLVKRVQVKSWEVFKRTKKRMPKADIITIAISPEWTPKNLWPEIVNLCRELGVDRDTLRAKKREATKKWKPNSSAVVMSFDFKFPYQARIV